LHPKTWQRAWESNPVAPFLTRARVSNAVASRPPRPLESGAGAVIRTLCASFGGWLLSQEHPGILGRGRRNRTPLARRQSTAFETARRPFTGALCMQNFWCPRRDLHSQLPKELVSKTSAYSFRHSGMEHRSGLEPDKSGFAIRRLDRFGIQCSKTTKLGWGGRTRTFERSGQSRVQWPLCYSPISDTLITRRCALVAGAGIEPASLPFQSSAFT
jgi:hypothetical protein